ncbi:MAG: group I intron-associated PD-(D/E)XK endonuclease [Actinomycetota bacterium]
MQDGTAPGRNDPLPGLQQYLPSPEPRADSGGHRAYKGEADLFGVYSPDNGGVNLVPVDAVGNRLGSLRVDPTRNNQSEKIRWARDYEASQKWSRAGRPSTLFEPVCGYSIAVLSPG